jgi:cell fate regulator YaaT (PSP1 superfamily)
MTYVEVLFKLPRREYFKNSRSVDLVPGVFCVVQAERGEDVGLVVSVSDHCTMKPKTRLREVLRIASDTEIERLKENRKKEREALDVCREKVDYHSLAMKVVDVENQLDGNKITFFFTAEERIDFRKLVKDLAATFRTRIELRQIGARDEARRFPGYGVCGRTLCCTAWLKEFEPVSLKMAKDQNLPLTPSKISGACGRLMCCLSYELPIYKYIARNIPGVGQKVCCRGKTAKVEKVDIFKEQVLLMDKEKNYSTCSFDEIMAELNREGAVPKLEDADDARPVVDEAPPPDEEWE